MLCRHHAFRSLMYIGNMSNPVITRVGINQFWYKHWFTDTTASRTLNYRQDELIDLLITTYLNYGLSHTTHPLVHKYWYKSQIVAEANLLHFNKNLKFFRQFSYTNETLSIGHKFLIRKHSGEYFPLRNWLMRFGKWLIVIVAWFKPLKVRDETLGGFTTPGFVGSVQNPRGVNPKNQRSTRLKLALLYWTRHSTSSVPSQYDF